MTTRRILATLLVLALGYLGLTLLLSGCETSPTEPVFENIFDPNNPEGGNPMQLTATLSDTSILLSWTQPQGYGISYYELSHSFNYFNDYLPFGNANHTSAAFGTLRYPNPAPTRTHYFKIQAYDANGNSSSLIDQTPASRQTPPLVVAGDGSGTVASRNITLSIVVSVGDSLRISNNRDFSDESRVAVVEAGQAQEVPWQFPAVGVNDTTLVVRVLAINGTAFSDTAAVSVDLNFAPAFTVEGNPATVAVRRLSLDIPAEGVLQMRFADTEASLDLQPWEMYSSPYPFALANSANPQEIWGQFRGDFDIVSTVSIDVIPDLLTDASFALDLPEDHITDQVQVGITANATARLMRFSESLNFTGVPWEAYQASSTLTLSSEPGLKTIYGQFSNDWAQSGILTDYVVYLSQPLDVAIIAPAEGSQVPSGQLLQVMGLATAASGTAEVDSVKFDSGGGQGFVNVVGTANWSYLWNVPVQDADTERFIRARAWAADDSVTTVLSVTLLAGEVAE